MPREGETGMRNLPKSRTVANVPFLTAPQADDTFGHPAPDDAPLSGVILRLNEDGTIPTIGTRRRGSTLSRRRSGRESMCWTSQPLS